MIANNKKPETEVCAYSVESCAAAARTGATRVELCASPAEGGTTPSAAAIRMARQIKGIELAVMIRPRGGDFLYNDVEFAQMKEDITFVRECGADCVVFGLLNPDGSVDVDRTRELVDSSRPMEATFHRAFDVAADLHTALEDVIDAGCDRILTSGGQRTAIEGIEAIASLVGAADGRIEIMAGSGVNPYNAAHIAAAGVDALHFSAIKSIPSAMEYAADIPMSNTGTGCGNVQADEQTIKEILNKL